MGRLEEIAKERWDTDRQAYPDWDSRGISWQVAAAAPEMLALLLDIASVNGRNTWEKQRDALIERLRREVGDG